MKRKFLSVLFALVLLLSLSLVTAVPAAAVSPPFLDVVPFNVTTGEWSKTVEATTPQSGTYSYHVVLPADSSGAGLDIIHKYIYGPTGVGTMTLPDITGMTFWEYVKVAGGTHDLGAGITLYMDMNDDSDFDFTNDAQIILESPYDSLLVSENLDTWALRDITDFAGFQKGGGALDAEYTGVGGVALHSTLAEWQASAYATYVVLWVGIVAGWGDYGDYDGYFDDFIINGDTYDLEPRIINTTQIAGYTTIQAAIDAADPGDTISVAAGTYTEDFTVNTANLTLKSESGASSTTIQLVDGVGIDIQGGANNFVLGGASGEGFTVQSSGTGTTFNIQVANAPSDVEISYNTINTTGNASMGISVGAAGATGLTISNNDFIAEDGDGSIWGPDVVNVTVSNNTFTGPGSPTSGYAVQFAGVTATSSSTISGNTISGYTSGVFPHTAGGTTGISDLVISNNSISECTKAIRLGHSSGSDTIANVTVTGNTLTNNTIQVEEPRTTALDMEAVLADNTFDRAVVIDHSVTSLLPVIYSLIQDAIDAAATGDTVIVAAGTYTEDITIDEEVTLQGAGKTTTTINRDTATSAVVLITANNVTITGFKIDGGSSPYQCSNLVNVSWTTPALENIEVSDCHLLHCNGAAIWINGDPDATWAQGTGYTINDNLIEYFAGNACTTGDCLYRGIAVGKTLDLEIKRNTITNSNPWEYKLDNFTYGGYAIYLKDYTGGTVEENIISKCLYGIVVNSNVEETFVNNNTITECHRGIATGESFAKIHITNNSITTRQDPGIPVHPKNINEQGILLGGDGDAYDSSPGYDYEVDNLQHEVSGNTVTGTATTDSFGLGVMPGWWDKDYGASGTFTNNTVSGYKYGIKVWGTYAPWNATTEDMTSQVNVSFNYNDIVSCTIGATTDTIWAGTVEATMNYWGDISGPENETTNPGGTGNSVSDSVDFVPWLTRVFQTAVDDNIAYFGKPMVSLSNGWNTFSTPIALDPGCDTWGEYVALGDGLNIHGTSPAYAFNGASQSWQALTATYQLKPCDAIYVRMAGPDTAAILYSPDPSAPTKNVYQGWNLIGLASLGSKLADNVLTPLYTVPGDLTGYSLVISPPLAQTPWGFVRGGTSEKMYPTFGYWVFMENGPDTLAGFTFTPMSLAVPPPVVAGLCEVPFQWYSMTTASADDYDQDDDASFEYTLPWAFSFGGKDIVDIEISSNGFIELLESGESEGFDDDYDDMAYMVDEYPECDFIFAWIDDLDSEYYGFYGVEYNSASNVVVVHWSTPTCSDDDSDYMNYFQLWLFPDGSIQWNFKEFNYDGYSYGLGTGIWDSDTGTLVNVAIAMGEPDGTFDTPEKSYKYIGEYLP